MRRSPQRVQGELLGVFDRLEARREEAAAAVVADLESRVPDLVRDPEVLQALRDVSVANTVYAVARGRDLAEGRTVRWSREEPAEAAENARFIARREAPLELLVCAYRRAQSVFWEVTQEEILAAGLDESAQALMLTGASRFQFDYFDHLISIVTEAYTSELERLTRGREQRRVEAVSRLLADGTASSDELGYRLEGHHLAMVVRGSQAESTARGIAAVMDCESLLVSRGDTLAWLWLSSRTLFDEEAWKRLRAHPLPPDVRVAAGEGQQEREGFSLSHRQAETAERVSGGSDRSLVRYRDAALLAAVMEHDTARTSFVATFLGKLDGPGRRNATLRRTLGAYFSAGQNAASAAAALGVHERTVRNRLRIIEELLGYPINTYRAELEVALRMVETPAALENNS